jgi:regulator of protease activity HflC (stomatin/prohibitin superfamily)
VIIVFIFKKPWILGYLILIGVMFAAITGCIVIVPAGYRAAVFNCFNGVEPQTLSEGTHVLVPFIERPKVYEVRTHTYTMSSTDDEGSKRGDDSITALSADGQKVKIDASIRYRLKPEEVWILHDQIGPDYVEKVIRPEAQTVIRNVVSGYTVTQLYSAARQDIQAKMAEQMQAGLSKSHMDLDEFLLRNIAFSEAFAQAIEQKQVALQEAERMKYVLQKTEAEKQRQIIAATGEAEAIRRRGQALKECPLLVKYEYVQKLSPNVKAVIADQRMIFNVGDLFDQH